MLLNERDTRSKRDVMTFSTLNGDIAAGAMVKVNVVCSPIMPGRQNHSVTVRDIVNKQDINLTFSLYAASREYVVFPGTKKGCLNVGAMHVDPPPHGWMRVEEGGEDEKVEYCKAGPWMRRASILARSLTSNRC